MLDRLKKMASGWVAQLFLAVLVLSFAVWGVSDIFTGFGQNAVARVGDSEITVRDFQRRYQLATQSVLQQMGANVTPQQLVQFGLPQQVLDQMVIEAAFTNAAHRMGMGLSNQELGRQIAIDPAFRAPTGQFDRAYLAQIINAQQMTENDFIIERRSAYTRNQLIKAFGSGNATPEIYLRAIHEYRDTERKVSYVAVSAPAPETIPEPNEADLTAFFDATKARWRAPEYRAVNFFVLSPGKLADPEQVTDEDARARYASTPDLFRIPAQRQIQQIVFKDRAEAEAAQAELAAGKTFDDLAKARGLQPADYDLGLITKDKIVDPAVADTAFSIPENSVSPIINGRFGPVIVNVRGAQEEIVIPFEDSKADIKQQIAIERASSDILNIRDAIEDARAGGATLAEAAAKFELKLTTLPAMSQGGLDAMDNPIPGLPVAVLTGAFTSDVGVENDPVEPDRASFAWFEVTGITPPRDRTLAEVRDRVVTAWKDEQRQKALDATTAELKKRLDAGETLAAVAADRMLMVNTVEKVTRLTPPSGEISAAGLTAIFAVDEGKSGVTRGATPMTAVVFTVDDVVQPAFVAGDETLANIKSQLSQQIMTDILSTYAIQLQNQTEVRYNQAAIATAVGISQPTQ
jgi:peptidyl-prolyl cis-trans isomerase D